MQKGKVVQNMIHLTALLTASYLSLITISQILGHGKNR